MKAGPAQYHQGPSSKKYILDHVIINFNIELLQKKKTNLFVLFVFD